MDEAIIILYNICTVGILTTVGRLLNVALQMQDTDNQELYEIKCIG